MMPQYGLDILKLLHLAATYFVGLGHGQQAGVVLSFGLLALIAGSVYRQLVAPIDGLDIHLGLGRWRGCLTLIVMAVLSVLAAVLVVGWMVVMPVP